ncbi:MAG TPA: 16S rRNA (cytidine(1402)-2'-O)-methyltransferase [Rectinemataceae bacterium]
MGELFVVATPIGNLGDITLRALDVLKSCDLVACEDTRQTLKLLNHFGISKPLLACHANDEARAASRIVAMLDEGRSIAYCTDAGTPGLSDPGAVLVASARSAGHRVTPIPGASAFAALLSVGGFGGRSLLFDGFLSPKPGKRRNRLAALLERGEAFLLYESPHRVARLLSDLAELAPSRRVCIGRELTKIHEQVVSGTALELKERIRDEGKAKGGASAHDEGADPIPARGEFAILVDGREDPEEG